MKHILIIGTKDSGKSTTIRAICKALNPSKIYKVDFDKNTPVERRIDTKIVNGTYVIEVNGKSILVVAGAPTEQGKCITEIIEHVVSVLHFEISFAIVARRTKEIKEGFDTIKELKVLSSTCVHKERIAFIKGTTKETIETNPEFIKRVDKLVDIIKAAIL